MKRSLFAGSGWDPWDVPSPARDSLTCLLTPLPGGKALSLALVHCLSDEIPDIRFTLDTQSRADAVWVCGYGERAARFLPKLRALHPDSVIVVTGRDPAAGWSRTILAAGADFAFSWPVDYCLLSAILHRARSTREPALGRLLGADRSATSRSARPSSPHP